MADKEERIYIRGYGDNNPCDTCEDTSGEECDFCVENYEWNASIHRKEAIKLMADAISDAAKRSCNKEFIAEAALNALLYYNKNANRTAPSKCAKPVFLEIKMPKVMLNMEMPKSCWCCKFSQIDVIRNTSICLLRAIAYRDPWEEPSITEKGEKDAYCPLQEVKE